MSLESQDCNNQEQHKSRQNQQDDYYMKAGRHELDSCSHREEREEERSKKRKVKQFYMK